MENFETYRLDQTGQQTQAILDQVNTNTADIAQLRALYEALTQSEPVIIQPSDTWPVADPQENVIYRVIDRVNTPPQSYSDYMWNGTAMVLMATYNNSIDNEPTPGSNNLVKSGGVAASIIFDISAYHATGSTLATYANLAAALGTDGANVPSAVRKGGMSVKFVQSSDNKYVQYRYMGTAVTGTPNPFLNTANWQGVDDEPTINSDNLVKSCGVFEVLPSNYQYNRVCASYDNISSLGAETYGAPITVASNNSKFLKFSTSTSGIGIYLVKLSNGAYKWSLTGHNDNSRCVIAEDDTYVYFIAARDLYRIHKTSLEFNSMGTYQVESDKGIISYDGENISFNGTIAFSKPSESFVFAWGVVLTSQDKPAYGMFYAIPSMIVNKRYNTELKEVSPLCIDKDGQFIEDVKTYKDLVFDFCKDVVIYHDNDWYVIQGSDSNKLLGFATASLEENSKIGFEVSRFPSSGSGIPLNIIVAKNEELIYYIAGSYMNSYNYVTGIVTSIKHVDDFNLLENTLYYFINTENGVYISSADETLTLELITKAWLDEQGASACLGIATNTTNILTIKSHHTEIRKSSMYGSACRITPEGLLSKCQINTPVAVFGDSIVGEYWISAGYHKVFGFLLCQFLGLDVDNQTWQSDSTTAVLSTLTKDDEVICNMMSYPDETYSNEHLHNSGCLQDRVTQLIQKNPQVIILTGGTNDFGYSCTLGIDANSGRNTCAGGLSYVLQQIITNLPDADVIVCTPLPRETQNVPNNKNAVLKDYVDVIKKVAETFGCPIIDLFNLTGIHPMNEGASKQVYLRPDGIHPNPKGYQKISRVLANKLVELF